MIPQHQLAVAAFVKTLGYSPLKTRLAAGVGRSRADRFYELAVAAIETTLLSIQAQGVAVYWAVAERDATDDPRWSRLPRVSQGNGSLNERLNRVTDSLHDRHSSVLVIGADSPQLTPEELLAAAEYLTRRPPRRTHVIGKTYDGGFYLFGSNYRVDPTAWHNAQLGHENAAESLLRGLDPKLPTIELPRRVDADSAPDLRSLRHELTQLRTCSMAQRVLLSWLDAEAVTRAVAE